MQKLLTFFSSKNISVYIIFDDQSFKDTLINDIFSFEQLGPEAKYFRWISEFVVFCCCFCSLLLLFFFCCFSTIFQLY